nr:DDE-type integrase/transposase/recombinase [Stutzerimonas nitrititolerans]
MAVVLNLYSCAVIGWAVHHRMQEPLIHPALEMEVERRQLQAEVLLHSNRDSKGCAYDYQALLRHHRIMPSYSREGAAGATPGWRAFFRSLKVCGCMTRYASYQEAKTDLFAYIRFHNHRPRYSTLSYLSSMGFERRTASSSS